MRIECRRPGNNGDFIQTRPKILRLVHPLNSQSVGLSTRHDGAVELLSHMNN